MLWKTFLQNIEDRVCCEVTREKSNKIKIYIAELLKWNKIMNLISRKSITEEFLYLSIIDSLELFNYTQNKQIIYDFGSGNGLPAIPCAIFNDKANFFLFFIKKNISEIQ